MAGLLDTGGIVMLDRFTNCPNLSWVVSPEQLSQFSKKYPIAVQAFQKFVCVDGRPGDRSLR